MKVSVWVGASRRRIGRGLQAPYWPGLSRSKAKRTLTGRANKACLAATDRCRREAAIQTRVGVLSPSEGSDVKRRPRKGLERKLILGNSYGPLDKNLWSEAQ